MTVHLVGAGPGDPDLLTMRAVSLLARADAIVHDRLVDGRILASAAPWAELVDVGKTPGSRRNSQAQINAILVDRGRRFDTVVRLKGGDPFVFGRGGEEALALRAAGVPFDVVPGVTSAVAAPALAGIPVTHRGVSAAVLIVSGHDEEVFRAAVAALQPGGITIVVLMGLGRRVPLAQHLVDRGWAASTPAAIVADASLPQQQVWRGTLGELAAGDAAVEGDGPASIVIGQVAAMDLTSASSVVSGFPGRRSAECEGGSRTVKDKRNASN